MARRSTIDSRPGGFYWRIRPGDPASLSIVGAPSSWAGTLTASLVDTDGSPGPPCAVLAGTLSGGLVSFDVELDAVATSLLGATAWRCEFRVLDDIVMVSKIIASREALETSNVVTVAGRTAGTVTVAVTNVTLATLDIDGGDAATGGGFATVGGGA